MARRSQSREHFACVPIDKTNLLLLMSREEATRLARIYLNEGQQTHFLLLDYLRILNSPTEYDTCWYFDFRYHSPHSEKTTDILPSTPGFTVDKQDKQARVITWNELYNLNQKPHPF